MAKHKQLSDVSMAAAVNHVQREGKGLREMAHQWKALEDD